MPLRGYGPTQWVLGHDFLRTLKGLFLFLLFPDRLDPRDWMRAAIIDLADTTDISHVPPTGTNPGGYSEFWFDYLSDSGDSQRAAYSLAYALHGDLAVPTAQPQLAQDVPELAQTLDIHYAMASQAYCLPRGAFVFFGGDTAYPASTHRMLRLRLLEPFNYAYSQRFYPGNAPPSRPFFAIPGNHDWYDNLDGFNRLFRQPTDIQAPPLSMHGFYAIQEASYVALRLPFGWQFWGVDAGHDGIDHRQKHFFHTVAQQYRPDKLILATPQPSYVYGAAQPSVLLLLRSLPVGEVPGPGQVRLDLSGDVHHYERYIHASRQSGAPQGGHVSVVSGLGGAFLHPSHLCLGDVPRARLFPDPQLSKDITFKRLVNFRLLLANWLFVLLVFCLGGILGAGATATQHETGRFATLLTAWLGPSGLETIRMTASPSLSGMAAETSQGFPLLWCLLGYLIFVVAWFWGIHWLVSRSEAHARQSASAVIRGSLGLVPVGVLGLMLGIFSIVEAQTQSFLTIVGGTLFYGMLLLCIGGMPCFAVVGSEGLRPWWKNGAMMLLGLLAGLLFVTWVIRIVQSVLPLVLSTGPYAYGMVVGLGGLLGGLCALVLPWFFCLYVIGQQVLFGGHATIAGALTTDDHHQQFIRFRLRHYPNDRSTLTGFVVAVMPVSRAAITAATPEPDTLIPQVKLIDVFTIEASAQTEPAVPLREGTV